jgi:hypothetical protein
VPAAGGPSEGGSGPDQAQAAWNAINAHPLGHFVVSELQAGVASITVYAGFVMISYLAQLVSEKVPLKYQEPAHFLDLVLAWAGAASGAATFSMITFWSLKRLWDQLAKGQRHGH